jgi:hypothetical protein
MTPAICGQRQSAARKRIADALFQASDERLPNEIATRMNAHRGIDALHIATFQMEAIAEAVEWSVAESRIPWAERKRIELQEDIKRKLDAENKAKNELVAVRKAEEDARVSVSNATQLSVAKPNADDAKAQEFLRLKNKELADAVKARTDSESNAQAAEFARSESEKEFEALTNLLAQLNALAQSKRSIPEIQGDSPAKRGPGRPKKDA